MIRALAVALALFAGTYTVQAQTSPEGSQQSAALGSAAYTGETKSLPPGYHDFVPLAAYQPRRVSQKEVVCTKWDFIVTLHSQAWNAKRLNPSLTQAEAYERARKTVNKANPQKGGKAVCSWSTARYTPSEIAKRGYEVSVESVKTLKPVHIYHAKVGGKELYWGNDVE